MSEVYVEQHSTPIRTRQQLAVVVLLAFLVPILTIVMIVQLITGGLKVDAGSMSMSEEAVAKRLKPVGEFALAGAAKKISATYYWPNQSHASLGPSCAVADVRADGSSTIWSASQGTHGLRTNLAKVFSLPVDKMRVVFLEGSGSYGTNGSDYVAADAVLLSKFLEAPVRVQWMRQDEHRWDPKGPQQLIDIQGGIDAAGRIVAWDVQMWVPTTRMGARALLAAEALRDRCRRRSCAALNTV
jgi:CO/xanthine dehydrogenase Mo-binding subunit